MSPGTGAEVEAKFHVLPPAVDFKGHPKGKRCGHHDGFIASGKRFL